MGINNIYAKYLRCKDVVIDSRLVSEGSMFFALKGEKTDGHKYAAKALVDGARYVVVDDIAYYNEDEHYILVDDVLICLQQLSKYHRDQFEIPVLAITGSNGKTTTKELLHAVLSTQFNVHTTKGNFNNHIGVPLTLLSMPQTTEIAVIEMGANHVGEIATLCKWAQPTLGLITNIGKAHLEGFGSIEGVIKGKGELFDFLKSENGIIFYNQSDPYLKDLLGNYYGAQVYNVKMLFQEVNENPFLNFKCNNLSVDTHLVGRYNLNNIGASYLIGKHFDISNEEIFDAISSYEPQNNRSELRQVDSTTYIMDAYNANPASMSESLQSFDKISEAKKGVVLGDMLELGKYAEAEHQKIIMETQSMELKFRIFVGEIFYNLKAEGTGHFFKNIEAAKAFFDTIDVSDHSILLKGSRGISVERILNSKV